MVKVEVGSTMWLCVPGKSSIFLLSLWQISKGDNPQICGWASSIEGLKSKKWCLLKKKFCLNPASSCPKPPGFPGFWLAYEFETCISLAMRGSPLNLSLSLNSFLSFNLCPLLFWFLCGTLTNTTTRRSVGRIGNHEVWGKLCWGLWRSGLL